MESVTLLSCKTFKYVRIQTCVLELERGFTGETNSDLHAGNFNLKNDDTVHQTIYFRLFASLLCYGHDLFCSKQKFTCRNGIEFFISLVWTFNVRHALSDWPVRIVYCCGAATGTAAGFLAAQLVSSL